jgi:nitrogenase molybdenum-iron protein alpha/beta subunit
MIYHFPRCRFADENTLQHQLSHVASEMCEALRASHSEGIDRTTEEIMDVIWSAETALWIIEKEKGPRYVELCKQSVIEKNRKRNYLQEGNSAVDAGGN